MNIPLIINAFLLTPDKLYQALRKNGFDYIAISGNAVRYFGVAAVREKLLSLKRDRHFKLAYQLPGYFWTFRVLP